MGPVAVGRVMEVMRSSQRMKPCEASIDIVSARRAKPSGVRIHVEGAENGAAILCLVAGRGEVRG